MKKRIVASVLLTVALMVVFSMAVYSVNDTGTPILKIEAKNVAFQDSVYMAFLVSHENVAAMDVELLVWTEAPSGLKYEYGTQKHVLSCYDTQSYQGTDCAMFLYDKVHAKQYADEVYFRAYVEVDGVAYYSDVLKYSVVQYNYDIQKKSTNEELKGILSAMLEYGARVQSYKSYNTNRLANSTFYQINVAGGTLTDGTTVAMCVDQERVTMTAPATDAFGIPFFGWKNSAGTIVGFDTTYTATVNDSDETYTAYYSNETRTFTVNAVNGSFSNGNTTVTVDEGAILTLTANAPPKGYRFSHWENSLGAKVGTSTTLSIAASANTTYKAYYEPCFVGEVINTDLQKDWQQGGTNGSFTAFGYYAHRVSFAEPIFLKAGQTLTISLPKNVVCPNTAEGCTGSCGLTAALIVLNKNDGVNTGDLYQDYSIVKKSWNNGGFVYTATADVYVMVTIKYESPHGSSEFTVASPYMKDVTVSILEEGCENGIGVYWFSEINDGIAKIEANRSEGVSEFFYMTDSHWPDNAKYSPAIVNYIAEKVNSYNVVFGGDIIRRYNADKQAAIDDEINGYYSALEAYSKTGEKLHIFTTLGNHDRNGSSNCPDKNLRLTEAEAYLYYMKRMEGWGVTVEGDANRSYFDDTVNKVRYIQFYFAGSQYGMDEDAYVDASMAWAEEHIRELDESWTVVLFTHGFFCGEKGSENEITDKDHEVARRMLKLQGEADAEIAIWITGHIHAERNEVLYDEDGNKLRIISMTADAYSYVPTMSLGSTAEQSFGFFQVDTKNQKIYMTRFGYGDDLVFDFGQENLTGTMAFLPKVQVTVVNGEMSDDRSSMQIAPNTQITLIADTAPAGYSFSHWINGKGETVGNTATLTVTVTEASYYRAVYTDTDPTNDTLAANQVMADIANEWQQGSYDGSFGSWCYDGAMRHSRISFLKPYLLHAGEKMTISLPALDACPTGTCASTCNLICAYAVVKPTGSNTGNMDLDYTVVSTTWGNKFTASEDCYVLPMIKYNKHGSLAFTLSSAEMQKIVVSVVQES